MKTLGDVKVGESSTIVKLHGEGALRRHLILCHLDICQRT